MNKPAKDRKYKVGDRVTVVDIDESTLAQPKACVLKHGIVTMATDVDSWTQVTFKNLPKGDKGWFFKPDQLVPINEGVVFVAMHQVLLDFQKGVELERAMALNGFHMII